MSYVIEKSAQPSTAVNGGGRFPVRRIFCVGKNYADHVKEMGGDARSDPPVFFTKPADCIVESGSSIPFPLATNDFHYEGELVVALKSGGVHIAREDAQQHIFGYAAGCDLTRRDHQAAAKKKGTPWDTAKGFDDSAPIGEIIPAQDAGSLSEESLVTRVNGDVRQDAPLSSMIWSIDEIIAALSTQFELKAGDLIYTGTPKGVGPLSPDDKVSIEIGSLPPLTFTIKNR
ncbi:MAG: fumarylacetoacetate hydrolase family protein [Pseudomonadota bacterium]